MKNMIRKFYDYEVGFGGADLNPPVVEKPIEDEEPPTQPKTWQILLVFVILSAFLFAWGYVLTLPDDVQRKVMMWVFIFIGAVVLWRVSYTIAKSIFNR